MLSVEMEEQGNYLFRYRSYFPFIFLIFGIAAFVQIQLNIKAGEMAPIPFSYELACLAVCMLGLLVRIFTVGYTPKNTSGRNTAEGQVADEVNSTGMYSTVRHPLYVGNFLMWLGIAMYTANFWFIFSFILLYYLYYERIMYAEEQFLFKKFGNLYSDWAAKTPAFIPSFGNWTSATLEFSIKKVLKKEKNGLFAAFFVLFVFSTLGEYIQGQPLFSNEFWLYGTIATGILYFILKFFKKYTKVFEEEGR